MVKRKFNEITKSDDYEDIESVDNELVDCINNHIYFYSNVNQKSVLKVIKIINNVSNSILKTQIDQEIQGIKIYLHINSSGGDLYSALSLVDIIKRSKIPIVSIIEGYAASAATLISIVCHERKILKNASMLIHQISSGYWGKLYEIKDDCKNLKFLERKTKKIYIKHSNMSDKYLTKILKHDILWGSKKCKRLKLVDEII